MATGEPRTINELFSQAIERRAGNAVMSYKRDKKWHDITGAQLNERVRSLTLALHQLGVRPAMAYRGRTVLTRRRCGMHR